MRSSFPVIAITTNKVTTTAAADSIYTATTVRPAPQIRPRSVEGDKGPLWSADTAPMKEGIVIDRTWDASDGALPFPIGFPVPHGRHSALRDYQVNKLLGLTNTTFFQNAPTGGHIKHP